MKKIPSNNSLFSMSNLSSSKIYMTAFVNKINDEILEDSPYSIMNFIRDKLSPLEDVNNSDPIHHYSKINYNEIPLTDDISIYCISMFIFVMYYLMQHDEFYIFSDNKTKKNREEMDEYEDELNHVNNNNNNANIINYILLAFFIIFTKNIEGAM